MARRRARRSGSGFWLFLIGLLVGAGVLWLVFQDRQPVPPPVATEETPASASPVKPARHEQSAASVVVPSIPPEAPDEEVPDGTSVSPASSWCWC